MGASRATCSPLPWQNSTTARGAGCGTYQPCSFVPSSAVKYTSSCGKSAATQSAAVVRRRRVDEPAFEGD